MRVLVTFAVEAEFAPWRKLSNLHATSIGNISLHQAQIGRASVDFVVTGMGPENARRVADVVMTQPYTFCIVSGFAGALRPVHAVGTILAAEAVQQVGKPQSLQCARRLVSAAGRAGAKQVHMLLTSDHLVRTAGEKAQLAPFADAVDMESFAILSAAHANRLPAVAIRAISDSSRGDMPVFLDALVDDRGHVKIGGVIRNVIWHPVQVPALLRLGRGSRAAGQALAHFLEAFIKKLSFLSQEQVEDELMDVAAR